VATQLISVLLGGMLSLQKENAFYMFYVDTVEVVNEAHVNNHNFDKRHGWYIFLRERIQQV